MEIVVAIAVVVAFELAVWLWGVDSRDWSLKPSNRPARSI